MWCVQLHNFMVDYNFLLLCEVLWYLRKHLITEHSNSVIQVWCLQIHCRLQFFGSFGTWESTLLLGIAIELFKCSLCNFIASWLIIYIFFFFWYWRKHLITEHSNPGIQVWCVQLQCRLQFFWFFWYLRNHHITEYSYWVVQVWCGQLHSRLQFLGSSGRY